MKKLLIALTLSLITITHPVYALVAPTESGIDKTTSTATLQAKIAELQKQLLQLQNQLRKQELGTSTVSELKFSPFVTTLKNGMTSNEVKELQRYLSTQTKYYPDGIVSGYYGPQTMEAVVKIEVLNP